jgi:carnitine O-acetyltransferase
MEKIFLNHKNSALMPMYKWLCNSLILGNKLLKVILKEKKISYLFYFKFRTHNKPGNSYESGSLRKFHLGRTDIIRSCSTEAVEFVKAMQDDKLSEEEKARLFLRAIANHRLNTMDVINFESFDRHLLGLKLIAYENNIELPPFYNDVAFQRAVHYNISSSQVSSKFDAVTFYGPAVDDGYGCCYNLTEKKIMFGLSSWISCSETKSKTFGTQLKNALLDCQDLLLKSNLRSKL